MGSDDHSAKLDAFSRDCSRDSSAITATMSTEPALADVAMMRSIAKERVVVRCSLLVETGEGLLLHPALGWALG